MKEDPIIGLYTEDELRKAAWIIGPYGAAARALAEADARRSRGELISFYRTRSNSILVGPRCQEMIDLLGPASRKG